MFDHELNILESACLRVSLTRQERTEAERHWQALEKLRKQALNGSLSKKPKPMEESDISAKISNQGPD